jgi:hypothetical protein
LALALALAAAPVQLGAQGRGQREPGYTREAPSAEAPSAEAPPAGERNALTVTMSGQTQSLGLSKFAAAKKDHRTSPSPKMASEQPGQAVRTMNVICAAILIPAVINSFRRPRLIHYRQRNGNYGLFANIIRLMDYMTHLTARPDYGPEPHCNG